MWKNLKALRESQGMKQDEFGESVGLKKTTYQGYESGTREPPASFWVDVANRYAVTTDYLLGLSDDPHGTAHGGKTALEANYDALDAHGRRSPTARISARCAGVNYRSTMGQVKSGATVKEPFSRPPAGVLWRR